MLLPNHLLPPNSEHLRWSYLIESEQPVGGGVNLLNRYTGQNLYRGSESLPLRQLFNNLVIVQPAMQSD